MGTRCASLLLVCLIAASLQPTLSISWRLFAGRQDCVSVYLPDNQWDLIQKSQPHAEISEKVPTNVVVNAGYMVSNRDGTDSNRGTVDVTLYDPNNAQILVKRDEQEGEVEQNAYGGRGPWKMCFQINQRPNMQWSLIVDLAFLTVNQPTLKGTAFEWQRHEHKSLGAGNLTAHGLDPLKYVQVEQVEEFADKLSVVDNYLWNVRHEVSYMLTRMARHHKTAVSTHARAFWYYSAVFWGIIACSVVQVVAVRMLFANKSPARHLRGII